jgi:hypothetical protein
MGTPSGFGATGGTGAAFLLLELPLLRRLFFGFAAVACSSAKRTETKQNKIITQLIQKNSTKQLLLNLTKETILPTLHYRHEHETNFEPIIGRFLRQVWCD